MPQQWVTVGDRVQRTESRIDDPEGTIHIALDESFSPVVCVGAAVADSDFSAINSEIENLYADLTSYSWMADQESFKKFVKDGFHMSNDDQAIADRFIAFQAHAIGFSSFIFFTESQARTKNRLTLLLYRELLRTLFQRYRSRPLIRLYFEQNSEMERYFGKVAANSLRNVSRPRPTVQLKICEKQDPPLLAISDYTMLTFSRWWAGFRNCPPKSVSTKDFTWRNLNAIRRSISVIRSLEHGTIARRDLPFSEVIQSELGGGDALGVRGRTR